MPDAAPSPAARSPAGPPGKPVSPAPARAKRSGCLPTLLLLASILAAVIGAPFVIGSFLPERYEARTRLRLASPPEKVFDMIADVQRNPMTGGMMQRIERLAAGDDGLPRWREVLTSSEVVVETDALERPSLVRRRMRDTIVPMTSVSETRIERAEGGGSLVTATTVTTIRSGAWQTPVFRFMMSIFSGAQTGLEGYWLHLAKELHDEVTFEGKPGAPVPPTATAAPAGR